MVRTNDHMLNVFQRRNDPAVREAYVLQKEEEAAARKSLKKRAKRPARKQATLITMEIPKSIAAGSPTTVTIHHDLEAELGRQLVHVTLKAGQAAQRVERKVIEISGSGQTAVTFEVPAVVPNGLVQFAAFVGPDYQNNLQHMQSKLIPVKD